MGITRCFNVAAINMCLYKDIENGLKFTKSILKTRISNVKYYTIKHLILKNDDDERESIVIDAKKINFYQNLEGFVMK